MRAPIIFALVLCAPAAFAADPALAAVFQHMDKTSATFKGFTADLAKIDRTGGTVLESTDKSAGTIAVRKAGPRNIQVLEKIETENGNQNGEQMELAASNFKVYHPKINTVYEYDLSKKNRGMEQAALALLGGSSADLQRDYKVTYGGPEKVDGQPATRLLLQPNDPQLAQMFPKMEVWISDALGIAVQEKFHEKGDIDYHVQTYSNIKFASVSDDQVKMKLPKDVKRERPRM